MMVFMSCHLDCPILVDEEIGTFEIPMHNRGVTGVEVQHP